MPRTHLQLGIIAAAMSLLGSSTSPEKTAAARRNGMKGGEATRLKFKRLKRKAAKRARKVNRRGK